MRHNARHLTHDAIVDSPGDCGDGNSVNSVNSLSGEEDSSILQVFYSADERKMFLIWETREMGKVSNRPLSTSMYLELRVECTAQIFS